MSRSLDPVKAEGAAALEPDPVVEAYKKDIDRSLVRESLRRTPDERVRALVALQRFAQELRRAGSKASGR